MFFVVVVTGAGILLLVVMVAIWLFSGFGDPGSFLFLQVYMTGLGMGRPDWPGLRRISGVRREFRLF